MPAAPPSPAPTRRPAAPPPKRRASRAPLWRAVTSLLVVGLALWAAVSLSPRLGLDLEGGTQIVLETQDTERVKADARSTDRALEVLRGRVDALGVAEPTLARSGDNRIIVELPGVQDPREAAKVIGQTAQLGFHQVIGPAQPGQQRPAGSPRPRRRGRPADPGRAPAPRRQRREERQRRAAAGQRRPVGGLGVVQRRGRPAVAHPRAARLRRPDRRTTHRDRARPRRSSPRRRCRRTCAPGPGRRTQITGRFSQEPRATWPSSSRAARCRCRSR